MYDLLMQDQHQNQHQYMPEESFNLTYRQGGTTKTIRTHGRQIYHLPNISVHLKLMIFKCLAYGPFDRVDANYILLFSNLMNIYFERGEDDPFRQNGNFQVAIDPPGPTLRREAEFQMTGGPVAGYDHVCQIPSHILFLLSHLLL